MERDGFCRSVQSILNCFLRMTLKFKKKNRACACHGFQTGLLFALLDMRAVD